MIKTKLETIILTTSLLFVGATVPAFATTCTIDNPFCCDPMTNLGCRSISITTIPGFEKVTPICDPRVDPSCPSCPECVRHLALTDLVTSLGFQTVELQRQVDSLVMTQYAILGSVIAGIGIVLGGVFKTRRGTNTGNG